MFSLLVFFDQMFFLSFFGCVLFPKTDCIGLCSSSDVFTFHVV